MVDIKIKVPLKVGGTQVMDSHWRVTALRWRHVEIEASFEVNNCYVEVWHEDLLIKQNSEMKHSE